MRLLASFVLAVCTAGLSAQTTFIVSETPGPDVDFADLPAAVAAAMPGDQIRLRAGTYTPATITKGLTLRGASGVSFGPGTMAIQGVPLNEQVILRRLDLSGTVDDAAPVRLEVTNSLGVVHLQSVAINLTNQTNTRAAEGVKIRLSPRVSLTRCTITGGLCCNIEVGTASFTDCDFTASPAGGLLSLLSGTPALNVGLGAFASVNGGSFVGADSNGAVFLPSRPGPGIGAQGGCRIGGRDTNIAAGDPMTSPVNASAIEVFGTASLLLGVIVDPIVTLVPNAGAPDLSQTGMGLAEIGPVPVARWSSPWWFPLPVFELDGPPGGIYALVASTPAGNLPTELGVLMIDPQGFEVVGLGLFTSSGRSLAVTLPAPSGPGIAVSVQPVILTAAGPQLGLGTTLHYERPSYTLFGN